MSLPPDLLRAAEEGIAARYGHSTLAGRAYDLGEPASRAEFIERVARDWIAVTEHLSVPELDNLLWYLEDPDNKEVD